MNPIPFEELSKSEQRVAIAKDAISQMNLGKRRMSPGVWAESASYGILNRTFTGDEIIQGDKVCQCCQLGSACLSTLRKTQNRTFVAECGLGQDEMESILSPFFDQNQMALMEVAFERGSGCYDESDVHSHECYQKAVAFGQKYTSSRERARAIFNNVIQNHGYFIP